MTTPSWEQVSALFHAALDVPEATRDTFVHERSAGNAALAARVLALLAEHDTPDGFLETPAAAWHRDALPEPLPSNGRIGPYRLLREIGRGGMGAVYLAARDDGEYQQQVALKLVKRGMDTDRIVARFRQERQLLAALDHPNIARLLDGGTTEDGRPYVVMEYVDGHGIREFCATRRLSVESRLALFRTLCSAVQHAHQALIVHRDIKAANVLVTEAGVPKLLDFGIARLLDARRDSAETTETLHALTPEYASPEQLAGAPVSTGTDVYSLGVLLYELLTDQRPFATAGRSVAEITQLIRDTDPPAPSTVVRSHDAARARRLRGDLDTIVLKAIHRDAERRYSSVEQLSEDLRRHLEQLPVRAQRDSLHYRVGKFVRRNVVGVVAASVTALALIGGMAGALWQARIARAERARADRRFAEVRTLATSFLFDVNDAIESLPGATSARSLLVRRALSTLDGLAREAPGDASLQRELAEAYIRVGSVQGNSTRSNLGDTPGALKSYHSAVALLEAIPADHARDRDVLQAKWQAYEGLANLQTVVDSLREAVASFERARDVLRELTAAAPNDVDDVRMLAMVHREIGESRGLEGQANLGDTKGAAENLRESVRLLEQLWRTHPDNRKVRVTLATSLMSQGMLSVNVGDPQGTAQLERAVSLLEHAVRDEPQNAFAREQLLSVYARIRQPLTDNARFADALAIDRKIIAALDTMILADPQNAFYRRNRAVMQNWLGRDLRAAGQAREAVPYHRASLSAAQALSDADPQSMEMKQDVALTLLFLGEALVEAGAAREAVQVLDRARGLKQAMVVEQPGNPRHSADLGAMQVARGRALETLGASREADDAFRSGVPLVEAASVDTLNQKSQHTLAMMYVGIGEALTHGRGCAAAVPWYQKGLAVLHRLDRRTALLPRYRPRLMASETAVAGCH